MPVVGLLSGTNRKPRVIDAIWKGLNKVGYTERQTATMEYRFAEGHFERLPALVAELVRDRAKVIVAIQSVAAPMAAKALTPGVPVVFSIGGDPVRLTSSIPGSP
jgi:putative ABC transport system substrate-binding protein